MSDSGLSISDVSSDEIEIGGGSAGAGLRPTVCPPCGRCVFEVRAEGDCACRPRRALPGRTAQQAAAGDDAKFAFVRGRDASAQAGPGARSILGGRAGGGGRGGEGTAEACFGLEEWQGKRGAGEQRPGQKVEAKEEEQGC